MKLLPRKMTFQLTPLLDLLLIVIFAQFLEVQQTSNKSEAAYQAREAELRQELAEQQAIRQTQQDREHATRLRELQRQQQHYREVFRSILRQQEEVGKVLSQVFDLPKDSVDALLKIDPSSPTSARRQAEELKNTLRTMQESEGRELLRMLITYSEMSKRCDVWEVYVTDQDTVEVDNGGELQTFRAGTPQEVEDGLFAAYKSFPEPKTLVILLFSYGDASAGARQRSEAALPGAIDRMRADTGRRNWFEFAVLGFAPEGPSLRGGNR